MHLLTFHLISRLSSRTVVTQDDPLGALNEDEKLAAEKEANTNEEENVSEVTDKKHMYTDQPILFRGHRSQTFDESLATANKSMHRSETMPGNSVASSLASSIKFFG